VRPLGTALFTEAGLGRLNRWSLSSTGPQQVLRSLHRVRGNRGLVTVVVSVAVALALGVLGLGRIGQVSAATSPTAGPSIIAAVPRASSTPVPTDAPAAVVPATIRNVVVVLADDLDWRLWNVVPRLHALQSEGTTFTNYVVSDSLCCPSRTSLLRGQYVHNHGVVSNDAATGGGWRTFRDKGYPADCLPTWLHAAGVRTGLIGKYLNGFPDTPADVISQQPGWDDFVVPISRVNDYRGFGYQLDQNGTLSSHGKAPSDFLNDVLDTKAQEFIRSAGDRFFLELATFTPHLPSPVAPRHRGSHAGEHAPRDPSFGAAVTNPPAWLAGLPPIGPTLASHLDRTWVRRAESAESVADSVDAVRASLAASGHTSDTLVIVTSDNGFHVGSYRTHRGKRTAFDIDTVVPMVMIGPGIPAGRVVPQMTSETDLGPTIADELAASTPSWVDGRSLRPLLESGPGSDTTPWRTGVLSESLGTTRPGDPDYQLIAPPSFTALRTRRWLYVESVGGESELYDRQVDPYELHNVIRITSPATVAALHAQLVAMQSCAGPSCRTADAMPEP
jgi:N-acetylglucosamine-6-sulfatase